MLVWLYTESLYRSVLSIFQFGSLQWRLHVRSSLLSSFSCLMETLTMTSSTLAVQATSEMLVIISPLKQADIVPEDIIRQALIGFQRYEA